ncbi:MAG: rhomboid family intramembrane serine protease [Sphingomonas sp.]
MTATNVLAGATAAAQLMILATGSVEVMAFAAGFIPARAMGAELPPDFLAVPVLLTPLTATLVHAGALHLIMNLVMLVFAGRQTEQVLGPRPLLLLYAVGAYAAAAGQWIALLYPAGLAVLQRSDVADDRRERSDLRRCSASMR